MEFRICCGADYQTPRNVIDTSFHFHAENEPSCPSHECNFCERQVEKVHRHLKKNQYEKYKRIRPSLIEHRATVEMEILKAKKEKLPPHVLMERILRHEVDFEKSLMPATDRVLFHYGPPRKRLQDSMML
jgi:hypothetical protein